jgi:hypothetical protein
MDPATTSVTRAVSVELIGSSEAHATDAELRYTRYDPYAVTLAFSVAGREITWLFGRDLLIRGVHRPAGDGDVRLFPCLDARGHAAVILELVSPDGVALVEARSRDLMEFLALTTQVVWPGAEGEHVGLDETIAAILVER